MFMCQDPFELIKAEGIELGEASLACLKKVNFRLLVEYLDGMPDEGVLIRTVAWGLHKLDSFDGAKTITKPTPCGEWEIHANGEYREVKFILFRCSVNLGE